DPITTDIGYHDMLLKLDLLRTPSEDCARLTFFLRVIIAPGTVESSKINLNTATHDGMSSLQPPPIRFLP
ncbi:MAG: hypothetical protein QF791_05920, partial [Nitrospinaceae bacterium]|nr:hypothetical protein [Nitrospinaceae bacterium]